MKINKRPIKYKKERVVLSDILPYELPVTFSNRYFYDFLVSNGIVSDNEDVVWIKDDQALDEIIKLLFATGNKPVAEINGVCRQKKVEFRAIPFTYKITHKENDFRGLTIIHPKNQLATIDFYQKYKDLIIYYCGLSPFSIRRPCKIARFVYFKDKTHFDMLSKEHELEAVEEDRREYENLKTYFVYKDYSNIHKFYESYKYHRCEKKYNKLFKFDIAKCFDSIYTHLVSWAILNKEIVKSLPFKASDNTFSGKFDELMRDLNYGETNGIVIGPEFSRIFAELILQNVDVNVAKNLKAKDIFLKRDYEAFRYVDDYFIFFNKDQHKDEILKEFRLQLKEFKLYINDSKTLLYEKPLITEITIAKQRITDLLHKYLAYQSKVKVKIEKKSVVVVNVDQQEEKESIYISSNRLITKFKTIIKESGVDYKDILNYSLALIERKIRKIVKDYHSLPNNGNEQKVFAKAVLEILDFIFFIYSVSPRVNTTIRLCRILRVLTEYSQNKDNISIDLRHLIFKKIYDNIFLILEKNKNSEHTQVETLYLLLALGELGKEYWLDIAALCEYFGIQKDPATGKLEIRQPTPLNYLSIVVLLFYMKNKKMYDDVRNFLKAYIKKRFENAGKDNIANNAELALLFFDVLSCPYLDDVFKNELLSLRGVSDPSLQTSIIKKRQFWFTKWTNFDFGKELDAKQSLEVY